MNKTIIKNILFILIPIIIIISAGITLVNLEIITTEPKNIETNTINTTLIINYGNNDSYTYNVKIANATVYTQLMEASNEYNFTVSAEYYKEYQSHFITSIKNVGKEDDKKYWLYYINGEYGQVSADIQFLHNEDVIEWKYQ